MRRLFEVLFSLVLAAAIAVAALVLVLPALGPVYRHPVFAFRLLRAEAPRALPVPVRGVRRERLRDSWDAPRPGGRRHRGIDIFAARGTPVLSTTAGIVTAVDSGGRGGRFVGVLGPAGEWHYYAHLEAHAPIGPGDIVAPGTVLGTVGTSGNAEGTSPHLHYGIYVPGSGALNPFPRLMELGGSPEGIGRPQSRPRVAP